MREAVIRATLSAVLRGAGFARRGSRLDGTRAAYGIQASPSNSLLIDWRSLPFTGFQGKKRSCRQPGCHEQQVMVVAAALLAWGAPSRRERPARGPAQMPREQRGRRRERGTCSALLGPALLAAMLCLGAYSLLSDR